MSATADKFRQAASIETGISAWLNVNVRIWRTASFVVAGVVAGAAIVALGYCFSKSSNNTNRQSNNRSTRALAVEAFRYQKKLSRDQLDSSDLNDKTVRLSKLEVRALLRAVVLQAFIDLREQMDQPPDSPNRNDKMERLHELVVNTVLDPRAGSLNIRTDVDLDLHKLRKRDAKALVKLLLRKTNDDDLRPETGASDNLIPNLENEYELYE